jgi:hypothetical protein
VGEVHRRREMSLRFAILKVIETKVGNFLEDVVYEHGEKRVVSDLKENIRIALLMDKQPPRFGERKWTESEVNAAFDEAWKKTITAFKEVTIRIL